jgi:hypothetical protein
MTTKQPDWKFVANLGDAHPLTDGGLFVYTDETGVYAPECVKLNRNDNGTFEIRRFILENCTLTGESETSFGVLSANQFHPDKPVWFADKLERVADSIGLCRGDFTCFFLSDNPCTRAIAWQAVGDYFGWDNLDECPLTLTREECVAEFNQGEI